MGDEDLLFGETEDITDGIDGMQVIEGGYLRCNQNDFLKFKNVL